jgi:dTDP-4-amino-4,6-dideoxygalactose transaminase
MKVPFLDLKAQYSSIRDEVRRAIDEVCHEQHFILGPHVEDLERRIAAYSHARHGIGVSSGTDALLIALMALGIGSGDEVITTPYTFFATAGAIARVGARPVFADIEPDSFNIDPDGIGKRITTRTKAIIPVHLFGQCADMDPILEIASTAGIPVIEDAAQAIGAEYRQKRAGSMGLMGCFSFYPTKNLGGFGDGGMVVTSDDRIAEKLRRLREHGESSRYHHDIVGGNFRLDTIQAAILKVKLERLDGWTRRRQENASIYDRMIAGSGLSVRRRVRTPRPVWKASGDPHYHIYNQYVIRISERDRLQSFLRDNGVGTAVYYPQGLHLQQCFASLGYRQSDFPQSEQASAESLALPVYPELSEAQMRYVADKIGEFFEKGA